jgi:hypothetical protein
VANDLSFIFWRENDRVLGGGAIMNRLNQCINPQQFNRFWTEVEVEALDWANSFEELADIAIIILVRMKLEAPDREIVQICGPMSTGGLGSLEANMQRFRGAVEVAESKGLFVFNQSPFQDAMFRIGNWRGGMQYCTDILKIFYDKVFRSGLLNKGLFLPDWQGSIGTVWEWEVMPKLGIKVEDYPSEWLQLISCS